MNMHKPTAVNLSTFALPSLFSHTSKRPAAAMADQGASLDELRQARKTLSDIVKSTQSRLRTSRRLWHAVNELVEAIEEKNRVFKAARAQLRAEGIAPGKRITSSVPIPDDGGGDGDDEDCEEQEEDGVIKELLRKAEDATGASSTESVTKKAKVK